jgi:hypothetical protein
MQKACYEGDAMNYTLDACFGIIEVGHVSCITHGGWGPEFETHPLRPRSY